MKHLYSGVLVVTVLSELLAAVTLIGGPGGVFTLTDDQQWSQHYGFVALVMASVPIWGWRRRYSRETATFMLGVLTTFNLAITTSLLLAGDMMGGIVLHGVLGLLSFILFVRRADLVEAVES